MPYTVNGIGTHYYGKKNLEKDLGICDRCGRETELMTYETRLWVVFIFIPLIPMGKKQIFDYCPHCTNHRVTSLREWERIKGETINDAMDGMKTNPNDPTAAIKMHLTLIGARKHAEAKKFAEMMHAKHGGNVDVQLHLGNCYVRDGQMKEAYACFDRALTLDPNNQRARQAMGVRSIEEGNLARARELTYPKEGLPKEVDASILFMLGSAYQKQNKHQDALDVYRDIATVYPELAKVDKTFRKAVKVSQAAINSTERILPKAAINQKWITIPALILLISAALFGLDVYFRNHQRVYLANQFPSAATISIHNNETYTVPPQSKLKISLPEGNYTFDMTWGEDQSEQINIQLRNDFFDRLFRNTLYFVNVGGSSVLYWHQTTYTNNTNNVPADKYRFYVGDRFVTSRHVDFVFEDFPETLSIEGSREEKTRIGWIEGHPSGVADIIWNQDVPVDKVLSFLEAHCNASPLDQDLLQSYYTVCAYNDQMERGFQFLKKRTSHQNVGIEWHRNYQAFGKLLGYLDALFHEYDGYLHNDPENPDFLYLKGRLIPDSKEAMALYDRVLGIDPMHFYAWKAKAYHYRGQGEYEKAKRHYEDAYDLRDGYEEIEESLFDLRFALKDYALLIQETKEFYEHAQEKYAYVARLLELYAAVQNEEQAIALLTQYTAYLATQEYGDDSLESVLSQMQFDYLFHHMDRFAQEYEKISFPTTKNEILYRKYLENGDLNAIDGLVSEKEIILGLRSCLWISLGWWLKDNHQAQEEWLDTAKEVCGTYRGVYGLIVAMVDTPKGDIVDEIKHLNVPLEEKLPLCLVMATRNTIQKEALLDLAEHYNYRLIFPHHFAERLIKKLRSRSMAAFEEGH